METFFSILALLGMGWASYRGLKWMLRSGQAQARAGEQLTPADLRALEESAERLMAGLRAAADECVARIERACAAAEDRPAAPRPHLDQAPALRRSIFELIDGPDSAAEIAKQAGLTTGEVDLMRSLRATGFDPHARK